MRLSLLALALAAAVVGCGPGEPSPPPPPPDDGGTGGGDQPSGGEQPGGEQPPGGDQPSGGGDAPAGGGGGDTPPDPGGGGSGGGGTPPDPGGGGAPVTSPDGTVTVERTDPSAECDGLVPAAAPSAVPARMSGDPSSCSVGISEGRGNVAVPYRAGPGYVDWLVFSPAARTVRVAWNGSSVAARRTFLFPQPDGWVAASATAWGGPDVQVDVVALLPDGAPRGDATRVTAIGERPLSWSLVEDPRGGVAFVRTGNPEAGPDCDVTVFRFDALGVARGTAASFKGHDPSCVAIAAVSLEGEALVVERAGETAWLHWLRADGTPARAPVDATGLGIFARGKPVFLAPLLDGSIVAWEEGGAWTRRFPHLGDGSEPPPVWLSARPGFTFRNTRGERGYALFPPPEDSPDCTQRIELLAPSGRRCGTVTLSEPGGPCRTRGADQGWDGTVVQQSAREPCAWRWWPRLLGE